MLPMVPMKEEVHANAKYQRKKEWHDADQMNGVLSPEIQTRNDHQGT